MKLKFIIIYILRLAVQVVPHKESESASKVLFNAELERMERYLPISSLRTSAIVV